MKCHSKKKVWKSFLFFVFFHIFSLSPSRGKTPSRRRELFCRTKKKPGKQRAFHSVRIRNPKYRKMYRSGYGLRLTFFQTFNSIILPKSQSNYTSSTSRVFSSSFSTKRVGTHNGSFHCDEALACFLIRLTNKFSAARIVRSRDPQVASLISNYSDLCVSFVLLCFHDWIGVLLGLLKVLDTLDAVLDVGGIYDPIRDRFDHHQKGFVEVFGLGFSTKLSSAGLVYKVLALIFTWRVFLDDIDSIKNFGLRIDRIVWFSSICVFCFFWIESNSVNNYVFKILHVLPLWLRGH